MTVAAAKETSAFFLKTCRSWNEGAVIIFLRVDDDQTKGEVFSTNIVRSDPTIPV